MDYTPEYYFKQYGVQATDQLPLCVLQLDPADRAVLKIADQRDAVQKKTFTKWVNKHLLKAGRRILDLFEGFKDGHNLLSLLEVLSHEVLPRERGRMRFHQIQNVQIALEFLQRKGIRLVNIRSDEIVDGNPKLTLGLVWTIILHYQVSDIVVPGQPDDITAKEALLLWSRRTVEGYPGLQIRNFSNSWRDGKAFLSILHRNRPDLIDLRKVRSQTARQNLEQAFSTAEREFGVTRLLDPEDVDVPEPDEKSIITYVSSLYDVFPEVPSIEQSLKDNERQLKTEEYRDQASSLLTWLQDVIMIMSQRNFPTTLIEMKTLLADFNRFKIEDVPPRLEMRKRCLKLFDELQSTGAAHMATDDELNPGNINRLWNRFEHGQHERDMALQSEIVRLERLQRLAEKIHRESKHCEDGLEDISRRVADEQRKLDSVHPYEARRNCDAMERALKNIEENVSGLLRDVNALQDGKYAGSEQLYRRVSAIKSQCSQLWTDLYSNVIQKMISKSFVEEGITTTKRREVVTEVRLVETNPAFRHVQHCLNWIEAKQMGVESPEFGSDMASIQMCLDRHQGDHQEIQAFRKEIEKCINDRRNLSPDEQNLYTEWLSKVEVAYSLLTNTSSRRMKNLESLIEFMQSATQELIWLNEKEEAEVTRDWTSSRLNVPKVEEFHKTLIHELERRESQFNSLQDRGNSMVLDRHPAAKAIEAYMSAMQSQWSWLLQLSVCLETHVKHAVAYYQFFEDADESERWMSRQSDSISSRYSEDNQSIEELQRLLKELQDINEQVAEYERKVSSIAIHSREVIPLKQRGQTVFSPMKVKCLCIYKQPPMVLQKGEEVVLLDNSQKIRWRVRTSSGQEDLIPAVCILIQPPNYEAIQFADRLKIQLDHLQSLFKMRQRRLRQNMVLATIKLVRGWDLKQFHALDPARREALLRALNEDATKLIAEVGENDREMRRLREELSECNQKFSSLSAAVSEEEMRRARGPDKEFLQKLDSVSYQLSSLDQDLQTRLQQPLPHDRQSMDTARQQQNDWERSLQGQERPVEVIRDSFNRLGISSPQLDTKMAFIDQKWEQMITLGNTYAERLKVLDSTLSRLEKLRHFVADQEVALGAMETMSADDKQLQAQTNELKKIDSALQNNQSIVDGLNQDIVALRTLLEESRPGASRHHDLEVLEKDVTGLNTRWESVKDQTAERLKTMAEGGESLAHYTNGVAEEQQFVAMMQKTVQSQPNLEGLEDAKKLLQPSMAIYNSLGDHQHQIEAANRHGGQFIREAKIYEKKMKQYCDSLHDLDAGLVEGLHKRARKASGADTVKSELDALNREYIDLVLWSNTRLKDISAVFSENNIDVQFPMIITERVPLLRTFRAELTKRSSMLVDEDMQEYFQQLADYEGYGGLQAMGKTGQTFGSHATVSLTTQPDSTSLQAGQSISRNGDAGRDSLKKEKSSEVQAQSPLSSGVTWRLKSPPVSSERLSQKVASIASLSGLEDAEDSEIVQDGHTLITVKQGCFAPKGTQLNIPAVLNPRTGRKVTLAEAVKTRLFDPKTGTILDARTNRTMSVSQAVNNRYISTALHKQLMSPCGITDTYSGKECTLLEAMQKDLYDPVTNCVKDPSSGKFIPMHQAVSRGLLSEEEANSITGEGPAVNFISQSQGIFTGQDLTASTMRIGLGEAVDKNLYNPQTGKILDPTTGNEITLLQAVEMGLINPSKRDVKDPVTGKLVSVTEAVTQGIIDPETGKYFNKATGQSMPLDEAFQRKLLNRSVPLPQAMSEGAISEDGKVTESQTGRTVTFRDALDSGIIDTATKCLVDTGTGEVLTVLEALDKGLIDNSGAYNPRSTNRREALVEAFEQGHIKLVEEDLTFGRLCVRDTRTNRSLTVAHALKQGIITSNGEFIDTASGRKILLKAAVSQGFVDKDVSDKLMKETSIKDASGRNISFLKAIHIGLIDAEKGVIRDPSSRKQVSLQQATTDGILSTEDAQTLLELLSPAIAQTTVTTCLQPGQSESSVRAISISDAVARGLLNERTGTYRDPNTGASMPMETAIEKGLLRLSSEWPSKVKNVDEVDQAAQSLQTDAERWMKQITEMPEISETLKTKGKATVESKVSKKEGDKNYSFTQTVVTKPKITETLVSETKHIQIQSVVDPRTKREIGVHEAAHRGLIDMTQGVFIHPITEEKIPIHDAIARGFVRGLETSEPGPGTSSVKATKSFSITGVIHPKTGQRLNISQAVKQGILDQERGLYHGVDGKGRSVTMKISEAIEKGFVIAEDVSTSVAEGKEGGYVHETKTFQLKSIIHPVTKERLDVADAIKQGILDEHRGLYINPKTGEKLTIPEAIERKLIDAELMAVISNAEGEGSKIITTKLTTLMVKFVVDPRTGETISVAKAIEAGILNQGLGTFVNIVTGETMSISDAIDRKLVIAQSAMTEGSSSGSTESIHINPDEEVVESNMTEEISSETVTFSINSVIDPRTMEMMSYDEAVLYGILDVQHGLYVNPMTKESMPINVALEKGLIHGEVSAKVRSEEVMHSSVEAGGGSFPIRNITSVKDPRTGEDISLDNAIKDKLINIENRTYFDVRSRQHIPLEEAFSKGFVTLSKATDDKEIQRMLKDQERRLSEKEYERRHMSTENGIDSQVDMKMERSNASGEDSSVFPDEVLNYTTDVESAIEGPDGSLERAPLSLSTSQGLRTWRKQEMAVTDTETPLQIEELASPMLAAPVPFTDGLSYSSAVKLGLLDQKTGRVRDPKTGDYITLTEAIDREVIDPNKTAVTDVETGKTLSLNQCLDSGIIDPRTGKINERKAKAEKITISPELTAQQSRPKPINVLDAIGSGLYDPMTGLFTDPNSRQTHTLQEAINRNIIDGNLVSVVDLQTGEKSPLKSALRQGVIDGTTGDLIDSDTGRRVPLLEAVEKGYVENIYDKNTGTLFDTLTGETVPLEKALTDGQLRSNEVKIVDTATGDVVSLDVAFRKGLVDRRTGAVTDKKSGTKMSPLDAAKLGLLAVVGAPVLAGKAVYDAIKDQRDKSPPRPSPKPKSPRLSSSSQGSPRLSSSSQGSPRLNGVGGGINGDRYTDHVTEIVEEPKMTIVYAKPGDVITPSSPQKLNAQPEMKPSDAYRPGDRYSGQLADSFDKLVQDLNNERNWISDVEQLLKDDQPVSEEAYKAQSQREALMALHGEVQKHQQPIRSLVYQSEQLVEHHQEELTPEQVTELQQLETGIKTSFNKLQKTCEGRTKHLSTAADELTKFEEELKKFTKWMDSTEAELQQQEEAVQDMDNMRRIAEQHKEMTSEVVAHGADVRYLLFAMQKYMEEAKLHKLELDAYKADRMKPSRLSRTSWIAMDNKEVEVVREKHKDSDSRYTALKERCSKFGDKVSALTTKQKEFNDNTWGLLSWLTDAEEKLMSSRQEASAPEPEALQGNLEKMKALASDAITHKNQLTDLGKSGRELTAQMRDLEIGGDQVQKLQDIIDDITGRHDIVTEEIKDRANDLQTAVTKSQGVQDAMEQLLSWLKETDRKLDRQHPVSLNQDKLNDQHQQLNIIDSDIENHKPSIDSVRQAAGDLIKTCDIDMAKALEGKVSDIGSKFLNVQKKCRACAREMEDVSDKLNRFHNDLDECKSWVQANTDALQSTDWSRRPIEQLKDKVEDVSMEKNRQLQVLERLQADGRELIQDSRTGDPAAIKMALGDLEKAWSTFDECLEERNTEASLKESRSNEYDAIKQEVVEWLASNEMVVDSFEPVAVDIDVVAKQIEELQPMLQDYYDFTPKMDEMNDLGNAYDALQSGDSRPKSPIRLRARRHPSGSILSPRLRSPSPTTGIFPFPQSPSENITSPMSSESSGVGSRKSSSDYLQLEDLSETQQDILDMNQRYELLGERLLDRQQELQGMLGNVKSFLQDLHDLISWLDLKERDVDMATHVATSEKEARKRLKEHEQEHAELLSKESMVDEIRRKGHDLMKRKRGVPGIEIVQQQLAELDDKWLGVKVGSERKRKQLEDIVADLHTYKEAGVHLQKWIAQKDKMVNVLGPVAMEPSMIKNQLEQVKVLQEELQGQEPLYDKFIQAGNAVLDKCAPDSTDAAHVSEKLTVISKNWDRLLGKLKDREKSLTSVEGLSKEFSDAIQELSDWTVDYLTTIDQLPPVATTNPEKHKEHLEEIKELEAELKKQVPLLEKVKGLSKKLAESTKDANTKLELRNKVTSLEKPLADVEKKLIARQGEVERASKESDKFRGSCNDLVQLLQDLTDKQSQQEPVSGDTSVLKQQAQQNSDLLKDINSLKPEVKQLIEKAKAFENDTSPEIQSLLDKVGGIQADWKGLQEAANQRGQQLEASSKHAQNYQAQLDKMSLWLQLTEDKLDGLSPDELDQSKVDKKLKEAEGLQGDILKMSHDQEVLNREGQALMNWVDSDKGMIKVRLEDINQRLEGLNEGVTDRTQGLEDLSARLKEFEDYKEDVKDTLKNLEEAVEDHLSLGSTAKDPKHQDKIASLTDDVRALDSQLDYLEGLLTGFDEGDVSIPREFSQSLDEARDRQGKLQHQLRELLSDMEAGSQIVDQFQNALKRSGTRVTEMEGELGHMPPVARDESNLAHQERMMDEFISRLNDTDHNMDDLEQQYNSLKADGYVAEADELQSQLESLKSQQDKLQEDAKERKDAIRETANAVDTVFDNLRRTKTSLDRAADELEMHESIGSDVNAIKRLQDDLKEFQSTILENMQKRVQSVTDDAQGLVQSAAHEIDTGEIEADLDGLLDKWNSLNAKVSERDHALDNAILQCGKFNDALTSLLSWLAETEDLVSHQKPPSPDFKVAKAQLQEQKFLLKMLDDRAPSVRSVKDTGMNLQKSLEAQEQKAIQNQVAQLDQKWTKLVSGAEERSKTLENIMGVAQEFQEVREPLNTWLDGAEKKFANLEPSAMDADGIENIIQALQDMEAEIRTQEPSVITLARVGKELQNHCKGDDVKNVQRKIDDVQMRFSELSDKLSDTLEQMEEALPLAKNFNDAHAKFIDWIVKMEPKSRTKAETEPEEVVMALLEDLKQIEPVLEMMNADGSQLAELAPGDAGFKVEDTLAKDMKRFEAVNEQIQKKAEKFRSSRQKSAEVLSGLDDLLEWFEDEEKTLARAEPISCDPAKLQTQLAEQKSINDDINAQKAKARDIMATGKRLVREGSFDDESDFLKKMDQLKQKSDAVAKLGNDRLVQLEQAMPLSKTFLDAHQDLLLWFQEVEPALAELELMSINQDTVKKQQDRVKILKQDIQNNKPLMDKLNKTGNALLKLSVGPDDIGLVQGTLDDDNSHLDSIKRAVRERSLSIDEALQQSAEFTDKLENMLETLTTAEEQIDNSQPVSAHPDKIREQIGENNTVIEDLQMHLSALESVQKAAEELIKQAADTNDPAVKEVKGKLLGLVKQYEKINNGTSQRNSHLEDALEMSEKFWEDLQTLSRTLKDLSDNLENQEPAALEPAIIREQQETLESLRDDIEASQFDLDEVHQTGEQLMLLCGEPDRPEVQKNIDDLDNSLLNITGQFDKRSRILEEALEKSMYFQDELMKTLVWLQKREVRMRELGPVAVDFDTIKDQWNQVKLFKTELEPKQVDIESLNQRATELRKDATPEHAVVVTEPLTTVNKRWDALLQGVGDRQRDLQLAMLNAGQFEHAINELLAWLDKTEQTLDEGKTVYGDRKLVEIELAKLKVLQNDIHAHGPSVKSVGEEGQRVLMTEGGAARSTTTKRKMDDLKRLWSKVQEKSQSRQDQLEEALAEANAFSDELEKTVLRLGQIEGMLITSRPVGGLPETAKEQLDRFMHAAPLSEEDIIQTSHVYLSVGQPIAYNTDNANWLEVHTELQELEPITVKLNGDGNRLIRKSQDAAASTIKKNLQLLQQSWEHIKSRSTDRKAKLEQAVNQAKNFHGDLNAFIGWLTDTEKILSNMRPVSRVMEQITEQIKDHKALQKDISVHREVMIRLDKTGTHLKYFSQKQDVVLIKNLLSSVQQRWERIVSRSAERARHLERGCKEAKQFNDMMNELLGWLEESEDLLNTEFTVGNDPLKIKGQIAKHKEFQKTLGAKQPVYDNVNRAGRSLKERCPEEDIPVIQDKLHDLKNKWNNICGKSIDRQRKLEEALLFSGQFNDALQALLDWLSKVEPVLGEDQMVHGDIDTVNNLVEEHKAFQQELGARANNVQFVRKRARELLDKSEEDTSQQQAQLIELTTMWDRVCKLSVNKQERLQQAHKLADDFHKKAQSLVTWLAQAERQLRYKGPLPDDEMSIIKQIDEHKIFEEEFLRQEGNLRETLNIGQDIMKRCHPDAVSTLKHWLSVLKARWEEISNWSRQRGSRLRDGLINFRKQNSMIEDLIAWMNNAETKLMNDNVEPLPEEEEQLQELMQEHMDFQNTMSSKQPEVDMVTQNERRRTASTSEPVSHIPMFKGLSGRRTPVRYSTPSRRRGDDDGRRTPEPHFKNPRVGALFNKWRQVWLMSMDRQRRLQEALDYRRELEHMKNFKFDDWRKRYLTWMHHNKSRIMDFFRSRDKDRDGKVTRAEFIDGIMASKFKTTPMEMEAVSNIFDRDGDGYIDFKEFVMALRPDREGTKHKKPEPETDSEMIQDEVKRQVHKCTCVKQYRIHKIGEGKYRFGDSQKLRLVRILRSTVMVRVGGGWMALDEFLVKNDPCRAKGKTNTELREQFVLAAGVSQSMTGFVSKSPSGSSYSGGSSTYSGATSPWSARSPSSSSTPVVRTRRKSRPTNLAPRTYKVRERPSYATPWRQRTYKNSPDVEVHQIMSGTSPDGTKFTRSKLARDQISSPRHIQSPGTPVSRSSSRASTGSRPFSPTGSETSEISEPEVFTTVQSETRNIGGRNETTRTYQTHVVQTRNVNTPTRTMSTPTRNLTTPTRMSKIPKLTPKKR